MKSLEELANDLKNAERLNDCNMLYAAFDELFGRIGLVKGTTVYGLSVRTWDEAAGGKVIVRSSPLTGFNLRLMEFLNNFIVPSNFPVESFTKATTFSSESAFFDVLTTYKTFNYMKQGFYDTKLISSNSKFNSQRHVVDYYVFRKGNPAHKENQVMDTVLSFGRILKKDDRYFFSTEELLEMVSSLPQVFYAKMEVKGGHRKGD